jgi:hypothetical protein
MRSKRRLIAAFAVAVMCAPGTWLRSEAPREPAGDLAMTRIADAASTPAAGWTLAGVWHLASGDPQFGGFSSLLDLDAGRFAAFSDRGWRLDFLLPESPGPASPALLKVFSDPVLHHRFFDIEAAARDPVTGTYWLASENNHAIHRFTPSGAPAGRRVLQGKVDWRSNSGIEAMVRLADGRFVVLPEGQSEGLLFTGDPADGGKPARFRIIVPEADYDITDAAVLPDGRLMVVLRKLLSPLSDGWPPFASLLAIGEVPQAGGAFQPVITLRLAGVVPPENYEGLALRPRADGRVDVWVIADDNLSVFQRTLLAKLVFDPQG